MPKETVFIRLSEGWPLEAAATFLAALAYPEEPKRRERFRVAFCNEAFVRKMKEDPEVARVSISAEYLTSMPGAYRQGMTRIHARGRAGQMLLGMFGPGLYGLAPRPSVNRLAGMAAGTKNAANVKDRDWGPSRPVIHAACALALMRHRVEMRGLPDTLGNLIDEPEVIDKLVSWSEEIRVTQLATLDSKWNPPKEAETIQFVLA